jgi:hypothetical protein
MLIAQGAHPRAIMERMGHSTITVTLDTYGHLLPKLDAALDDAIDAMYRTSGPPTAESLIRMSREHRQARILIREQRCSVGPALSHIANDLRSRHRRAAWQTGNPPPELDL